MKRERKFLLILLWMVALMGLSAIVVVVMPHSWMDWLHQKTGLGTLPDLPIVNYLTRSLSLFYVWIGALCLFAIFDLDRHLPFVRFFSLTGVAIGIILTGIDLTAGVPWWWTVSEGAFAVIYFGAMGWLSHRLIQNEPENPENGKTEAPTSERNGID